MTISCPKCGTEFADTARFCNRDGTPLTAARTATTSGGVAERRSKARELAAAMAGGASTSPPAHATLAGQTLDGRYRIERKLGEGGMSFVYLATDLAKSNGAESRCAVKVLSPALSNDRTAMARLRREADIAGKVRHPSVCHIESLGQTADGLAYVVMPYLEGEILADRTYRMGQIPLAEAVGYVFEIAAGLEAAHQQKIVHRDLKPENVMITTDADGQTHAVVMDFGLAKERLAGPELEKLTATGIVLGTPEFMSPEQLRGKVLDGRSDEYSLALITVEMLTGTLPFSGKSQQEIMLARLRSDPAPIRKLRPDLSLPSGVERVITRGLARNPDDRYPSAPEFAVALETATRPGTIGNTAQVLKKWFR